MGAGLGSAMCHVEGKPLALQFVMFIPALMGQGTAEQQAKWLEKAYNTANYSIEQGDLQLLPDLHGLACALKALCSSETANVYK